jgi:ABC-type polysaccharide/polyol phosphate export permease
MSAISTEARTGALREGALDVSTGLRRWSVWWTLSWYSIRSQYRRTYFGPWWMTIQMVIFVAGLSLLFGVLLQQDLRFFVPYVAIGYIGFNWMTGLIQSGANSMTGNSSRILTSNQPLSIYVLRGVASNTIQFGHDAVVIAIVLLIFGVQLGWSLLYLPVALALILINGLAIGLWLGPCVARFRDVEPIVTSAVRVLFFFTPVFWVASDLSTRQQAWLSGWNPLAYFLELFRAPLLGLTPPPPTVVVTLCLTAINVAAGLISFGRSRPRIAYWV